MTSNGKYLCSHLYGESDVLSNRAVSIVGPAMTTYTSAHGKGCPCTTAQKHEHHPIVRLSDCLGCSRAQSSFRVRWLFVCRGLFLALCTNRLRWCYSFSHDSSNPSLKYLRCRRCCITWRVGP
jgi:hypothetical protein